LEDERLLGSYKRKDELEEKFKDGDTHFIANRRARGKLG
jgi:hypothetical protein